MQDEKKELKEYAQDLGKKLGFLVASLQISNESRNLFFTILDDFSLEQIERLVEVLENKLLMEKTSFVDEAFKKELEKIQKDTLEKVNELNEETIKSLSI
jgi:hypothetical protein